MKIDKTTIMSIFGCLMKDTSLLTDTDKYRLTTEDFETSFERYLFSGIYNLYVEGAENISVLEIENYLLNHEHAKVVFKKNNGAEYLQDALDISSLENFQSYYNRLKKYNALISLSKLGFVTSGIYCDDLLDKNAEKINEKFEKMTVTDIFDVIKNKLYNLADKYATDCETAPIKASKNIRQIVASYEETPEIGASLQGKIFNTVSRGARKGKFYIRSGSSGSSKSRQAVGDACFLSYPIRYNRTLDKWELNGNSEKTLFIATEQDHEEIQTLILSYLTDINEEKILYGNYSSKEKEVVLQGIEVMEQFDNLIIVRMSNPSIEKVKNVVRNNVLKNNVENVFYDYIFSSPSLLLEFRDLKIREDVALTMMSTALKDLAVELNVFVASSTQTNSTEEKEKGIKNQKAIRGSKGIIDKCDLACLSARVTAEEKEMLLDFLSDESMPNIVTDVYKVRRGRFTNIRIWSYVDLGTCRKKDLFVTDEFYGEVSDFILINEDFSKNNNADIKQYLNKINKESVVKEREENPFEL